jgi:NAD(P)H-dependent FMN reductase
MNNNILIINFSLQHNSQSHKVGEYIKGLIPNSTHLDYINLGIPMWDETKGSEKSTWIKSYKSLIDELTKADAYIYVVPEYNGAASPAYHNFNCIIGNESNHKPVMLVGVSASRGGAYPISQIRGYGSKNNKTCFIPEHVIVRDSPSVLNVSNNEISRDDQYLRDRLAYTLEVLDIYASSFKDIRSKVEFNPKFANGM